MRSAPPVLVPVGRFVLGHGFAVACGLLVGVSLLGMWYVLEAPLTQGAVWLALWLLASGLSWRFTIRDTLPAGTLAWDGESWHYEAQAEGARMATAPVPVAVRVVWDAGSAMLVAVRAQHAMGEGHWRGPRFAWLRATELSAQRPGRWHAWRCAVYADDIL